VIKTKEKQPLYIILFLILAGEAVFILPFVLARIFRPTFLEAFDINNFQLGTCFSIYGIVALFSYLFGGPLSDKYHPRYLMSIALILTAIGGIFLSTFPAYEYLKILFGYWGFTTILLFWAAMIKATRIWGGSEKQGVAFGFLDGGRGLVAAGFGSLGVFIFSILISDISQTTLLERKDAFRYVILISSAIVAIIGVLVFFFLKNLKVAAESSSSESKYLTKDNFKKIIKIPSIWLLMIIILCAYFGYKTTDIFSLYANEVMGFDDIKSAKVGTSLLYLRPIIGVVIGLLADRTRASLWLIIGFFFTLITSVIFATGIVNEQTTLLFSLSIGLMSIGVYSARVLYFAAMEEGNIPVELTGTAVGILSIVGYTPDIFSGPLLGVLLDSSPGKVGHQHVFMVLAGFTLVGLITSVLLYRSSKKEL
jgi:sugar phosphate permease